MSTNSWFFVGSVVALATVSGQAQAQTFSLGANFTTMTYSQSTGEPPDTMGAAGPNHFVAFNNDGFSIFNKNGTLVSSTSPAAFWTGALGANPGGLTDPRILYDPASQRWFAVMVTTDQSTNNKILFARSNTADPTQGFKGVSYTTNNGRFADFPALGLDANGVYVGTNNFTAGGSFRSEGLYSVPKADLLATNPTLARLTSFSALSANTVGFTLQAAVNYGPKLPTDPEIILANSNISSVRYNFTPLNGTNGSGATLGSTTVKTVQSTSNPTNSPQPASSNMLDNGDDRFSSNVVQMGNFLYLVQNITVSGRSAVRWTIANATTFNIVQQGTISDPTLSLFYPSIAVNASGDVVVGFSGSSTTTYASTYAVVGSSAGGAAGGTLAFGTPIQTKAGSNYYDGNRWGDYSATTPDPTDPGIFWTHQEYAAARLFSGTNWNWATEATEIIPTKAGERRWSNTAGGNFATGSNYFTGAVPAASDQVIFSRPSASYTVTFPVITTSDRASIRQGNVTWNLAGGSYTLSNNSPDTPSLVVGEFQGTASLAISGGPLNTFNATIAGSAAGSGAVALNAGAAWTNSNSVTVGGSGPGALTIQNQGSVYVGTNLSIGGLGTINLNGGTIRFDGYSRVSGGVVNFTSGTVQVAGDRTIDTDAAIKDLFGAAPTIGPGKKIVVEGNATISATAPVTLSGGTFAANSLVMSSGSYVKSSQSSQVMAPILAQTGSVTDVVGGDLVLGDATKVNGYFSNGTLHVGSSTVTLADADGAVFDGAAQVTLGAGANTGTLSAASGLTVSSGGGVAGHGTITTPDNAATPLVNNGTFNGNSMAQPLTLPGYVTGTGSMDNVKLTGTYSPGFGPANVSLGSAEYDGLLNLEIGGVTSGSDYDQLNHVFGDGAAQLGGTLNVSLISGFMPISGDIFHVLTAAGSVTGTFASSILPSLNGNLFWNINYGPNSVDLMVAMPGLAGDFNGDNVVDAADYVAWRKGLGTVYMQADYDVWRENFGQTAPGAGNGSGANVFANVPEPATLVLLMFAATGCSLGRNRATKKVLGMTTNIARRQPIVLAYVFRHTKMVPENVGAELLKRI